MKRYSCAAAAALTLLLPFVELWLPPWPADAQECMTIERVAEQIRREAPDADQRLVSGQAAARLGAGISTLIGQHVPEGGSYLIVQEGEVPTAYIVRFANGCATHHGKFPIRLVRNWLSGSPT